MWALELGEGDGVREMPGKEDLMGAMTPVAKDHPLMKAWEIYKRDEEYVNTVRWARSADHTEGSLWAAFMAGWTAATERAGMLHESIDSACDHERTKGHPGAGAMAAVIAYRDAIREEPR